MDFYKKMMVKNINFLKLSANHLNNGTLVVSFIWYAIKHLPMAFFGYDDESLFEKEPLQ